MNSRSKPAARGRFTTTPNNKPVFRKPSSQASTTPSSQASTDTTADGKCQNPQDSLVHKLEMNIAYSNYLQAKFMENLIKKAASVTAVATKKLSLERHEAFSKQLSNLTILKQRISELKALAEEEKTYDESIDKLKTMQASLGEIMPKVDELSGKLQKELRNVEFQNTCLPTDAQEKDILIQKLENLPYNLGERKLTNYPVITEYIGLLKQLAEMEENTEFAINKCKYLLQVCEQHNARCISLQSSLQHCKESIKKC